MLDTIATVLSIAGAIFNGAGTGMNNTQLTFAGQLIWICSNVAWMRVCYKRKDYKQFIVFATFFIAALGSVVLILVR